MQEDEMRESSNIEDRRGAGGGGGGLGRAGVGGLGIGAVLVLTLIGWVTGINPSVLIGGAEQVQQQMAPSQQQAQQQTQGGTGQRTVAQGSPTQGSPTQGSPSQGTPSDTTGQLVARILGETENVWSKELPAQTGRDYVKPILVLYSGVTDSGCGTAQSAMGPFYCPIDRKLYLDTTFFDDMKTKLGGGGDFAYAYVISHEIGHHLQNLLGILPKVQQAEQQADKTKANDLSVRTELMADCLAGAWANHMNATLHNLDQADLDQAQKTATAIGDDRLQHAAGRAVVPDSFTHGSSAQRSKWLATGFKMGTIASCNTYEGQP